MAITIAWMVFIFSMSAQPAAESTNTSLHVGRLVCSVFVPHYHRMSPDKQTALAKKIDHPVRKTAHATEYAILGILLCQAVPGCRYLVALILSAAYAASDEFHQLFVPGRSGQITDVMIDTCGAAAGLLVTCIIMRIHSRK